MQEIEINELLNQCDKLRDIVRAVAAVMDNAEKRLQRIERQGRIWLFQKACGNGREKDED